MSGVAIDTRIPHQSNLIANGKPAASDANSDNGRKPADLSALSPRERDTYDLLSRGLQLKTVGAQLGIAFKTVQIHADAVYKKTGMDLRELIIDRARRDAEESAAATAREADDSLARAEQAIQEGLQHVRAARGTLFRPMRATMALGSCAMIGALLFVSQPAEPTQERTKIESLATKEGRRPIAAASTRMKRIHRLDGTTGDARKISPENLRTFYSEEEIERALKDEGYRWAK